MGIASPSHQDRLLASIQMFRDPTPSSNPPTRNGSMRTANGNGNFSHYKTNNHKRNSSTDPPPQYQEICHRNGIPV